MDKDERCQRPGPQALPSSPLTPAGQPLSEWGVCSDSIGTKGSGSSRRGSSRKPGSEVSCPIGVPKCTIQPTLTTCTLPSLAPSPALLPWQQDASYQGAGLSGTTQPTLPGDFTIPWQSMMGAEPPLPQATTEFQGFQGTGGRMGGGYGR